METGVGCRTHREHRRMTTGATDRGVTWSGVAGSGYGQNSGIVSRFKDLFEDVIGRILTATPTPRVVDDISAIRRGGGDGGDEIGTCP